MKRTSSDSVAPRHSKLSHEQVNCSSEAIPPEQFSQVGEKAFHEQATDSGETPVSEQPIGLDEGHPL